MAGVITVLASTNVSPILTYILAVSFKDETFSFKRAGLVLFGLIGVGLIILPNQHGLELEAGNWWLYLALLIPLSYAFSAVYISRFHPGSGNVLSYSMWMLMFSSLCISPLAVINQGYYPLHLNDLPSLLIVIEILLSTLGYGLLFIIIKKVGAVYYTLVNAVAVITGVLYGVLLFGQHFSNVTYMAIAIILLTIVGLTYTQQNKN